MNHFLYFIAAITLLSTTACDRSEAVQEAREANSELVTTERGPAKPAADATKVEEGQELELKRVDRSENPLEDLTQEEKNTKLIEVTEDEVADQAIEFMSTRIDLTDEQKDKIYAISAELNLANKGAADRKTALKALRKRIKTDVLTANQMRQFRQR